MTDAPPPVADPQPLGRSPTPEERLALRRRDFWASIALIALSVFFLWRTSRLPFFEASAAGVEAEWYNSAALVPYGVWGALLALSLGLLSVAIREGGAPGRAAPRLPPARLGGSSGSAGKVAAIAVILLAYIVALVPRVDFVLASALTITALIYGFHEGRARAILLATGAVSGAGLFALLAHFPQAAWSAPGDDWAALGLWIALSVAAVAETRARRGRWSPTVLAAPLVGFLVPLALVSAMAFGFRQNVPARTGLLFGALEYHYYVTLRPWLAGG